MLKPHLAVSLRGALLTCGCARCFVVIRQLDDNSKRLPRPRFSRSRRGRRASRSIGICSPICGYDSYVRTTVRAWGGLQREPEIDVDGYLERAT